MLRQFRCCRRPNRGRGALLNRFLLNPITLDRLSHGIEQRLR